ncbi:asparagine synthase-related protein [Halopseudomonas pertucinogena]|uniref:asparagine synthase (glutamine-hydrolyzing) n=1 Tax=Halopseudomonas pertucinogena TaxID=86175 RepID=A0ABQ2CMY0_9GAMM|nr:asparagine synthetase B family protein [Halopseudomonas pertucinogena]GGI96895.1 hypothetical protein GCM10009083_11970 [Halopseudomonas pertucinogena]
MDKIATYFRSPKWSSTVSSLNERRWQCGTILRVNAKFEDAWSLEDLASALKTQNGFFALVKSRSGKLLAAVDHIRSIPIFYGEEGNVFYLSDDADWVRRKVNDREMDALAKEEFQAIGYVTGASTLFRKVKQLQAGECLEVTSDGNDLKVLTKRFFRFLHVEPNSYNEDELEQGLDAATVRAVKGLIEYAAGRQIVVPLSGGYDSRLIASTLRRLGYENILSFSYGVHGNNEAKYAEKVASALGIDWHFIEYNNQMWEEVWQLQEFWDYQRWGSGWASYAHIQDWPAVRELKRRSIVQADCVFAPGHCCVTGLLPQSVFEQERLTSEEYAESLMRVHYKIAPASLATQNNSGQPSYITRHLPADAVLDCHRFASMFSEFGWSERQAKYICNSVRVYEYFDFDWWLPLWDMDFSMFWKNIPLKLRENRAFYKSYVKACYNKEGSISGEQLGNAGENLALYAKQYLSSSLLFKKAYVYLRSRFARYSHPMAFYGQYNTGEHKVLMERGYTVMGLGAYDFLKMAENEMDK